ncbi:hypothetical protein AsAng_0060160 [Aureispira anguillae]|uniref:Uncharacterized protein n=1 Tax=Aureispira anguillae TaxID=2864201 RepID=A0A915YLQ5_9BACT|nr:hypothetical protein AsAng_0060160 [Aureispira anguillae]
MIVKTIESVEILKDCLVRLMIWGKNQPMLKQAKYDLYS